MKSRQNWAQSIKTDNFHLYNENQKPSVNSHNRIALKIPCTEEGVSEITIFTGVAPNPKSLELRERINNGTLDGKSFDLSDEGKSCLYHANLPNGVTDIGLINTSDNTIDFDTGSYSVAVSIHGTVAQHLGTDEIEKQSY